jgi:Xaa-Pro aminopeptidase
MIMQEEYATRRKTLANLLPKNSVALIASSKEMLRNGDAHYRFRQRSDFFYLTGFNEPEACLILFSEGKSILFNRPRNQSQEQWTGRRLGNEMASQALKMDASYPIDTLSQELPKLLAERDTVLYLVGVDEFSHTYIFQALESVKALQRRGIKAPNSIADLEPLISEMRLFKSPAECALMRKAAHISVEAHLRAMTIAKSVKYEYELEAEITYTFLRHGCRASAYDSIVASGENACILHYTDNNQPLNPNALILIDAGGEYGNYAADITRTFPKNGEFTPHQRDIYELVLKAQKAGVAAIKPGLPWNMIQTTMIRILTEGLCELGLLTQDVETCITKELYKPFYMHNSGHWLGLDVHDCGSYKKDGQWRPLEPGMVLTVEPGLYIPNNIEGIDSRYWNIGVRIEDDILVTKDGHENLTGALPVEIQDIEALMRG